jgi:hypothetical protein
MAALIWIGIDVVLAVVGLPVWVYLAKAPHSPSASYWVSLLGLASGSEHPPFRCSRWAERCDVPRHRELHLAAVDRLGIRWLPDTKAMTVLRCQRQRGSLRRRATPGANKVDVLEEYAHSAEVRARATMNGPDSNAASGYIGALRGLDFGSSTPSGVG